MKPLRLKIVFAGLVLMLSLVFTGLINVGVVAASGPDTGVILDDDDDGDDDDDDDGEGKALGKEKNKDKKKRKKRALSGKY